MDAREDCWAHEEDVLHIVKSRKHQRLTGESMSGTVATAVPEEAIVAAPPGWMGASVVGDSPRPSGVRKVSAPTEFFPASAREPSTRGSQVGTRTQTSCADAGFGTLRGRDTLAAASPARLPPSRAVCVVASPCEVHADPCHSDGLGAWCPHCWSNGLAGAPYAEECQSTPRQE